MPSGDHVVQSVAVNVIDEHLSGGLGELERMLDPRLAGLLLGGMLPPAVLFENVDQPVAVDIARADAVRETLVIALRRDRMKDPRFVGLGRIVGRIAHVPGDVVDQLRPAVAVDIDPDGRFVADILQGQMLLPGTSAAPGFSYQKASVPGNGSIKDIRQAVAVEIAGVGEEVVRIIFGIVFLRRTNLVFSFENRAPRTKMARPRYPAFRPC